MPRVYVNLTDDEKARLDHVLEVRRRAWWASRWTRRITISSFCREHIMWHVAILEGVEKKYPHLFRTTAPEVDDPTKTP